MSHIIFLKSHHWIYNKISFDFERKLLFSCWTKTISFQREQCNFESHLNLAFVSWCAETSYGHVPYQAGLLWSMALQATLIIDSFSKGHRKTRVGKWHDWVRNYTKWLNIWLEQTGKILILSRTFTSNKFGITITVSRLLFSFATGTLQSVVACQNIHLVNHVAPFVKCWIKSFCVYNSNLIKTIKMMQSEIFLCSLQIWENVVPWGLHLRLYI